MAVQEKIGDEQRECRKCSECQGDSHHWTPDPIPPEDDDFEPGDYACRHCNQRGDVCMNCEERGCEKCGNEGVVPLSADGSYLAARAILERWDVLDGEASHNAYQAQDGGVYVQEMIAKLSETVARYCETRRAKNQREVTQ